MGLDDVPLGVGTIPKIFNLVQATNADGVALYVNAEGKVVETPPENMVDGYYPLYIDEGELTLIKLVNLLIQSRMFIMKSKKKVFLYLLIWILGLQHSLLNLFQF